MEVESAYASAAKRTHRDAERLAEAERLGTADHLFGLAAECALKAVLHTLGKIADAPAKPPRPWKVHMPKLWSEYEALAGADSLPSLDFESGSCPFSDWTIDQRYEHDRFFLDRRDAVERHRRGSLFVLGVLERVKIDGAGA
jgi:hypothetical protein